MAAGQTPGSYPPSAGGYPPSSSNYPPSSGGLYPPYSTKSHIIAGLLALFLGSLGVHKFYLGYYKEAFIMLAVSIIGSMLTLGFAALVISVIAFIEGIIYLATPQQQFIQRYIVSHKEWF